MNVEDMSYRQWQKRNRDAYQQLSKEEQKQAREQGYYNLGWLRVQASWEIIKRIKEPNNLFDAKLRKGNLVGALSQSILEAEQAQKLANQGITDINKQSKKITKLAKTTLSKYQLL